MNRHDKINILFVLPSFDTGGSEKLVIDIINNIDKNRFRPVLIVFFTGTYEKQFRKQGVPFYIVHEKKLRSKWSTFFFLRNIIKKYHIDIVNTNHTSPLIQGFLPFCFSSRLMWVHTEHTRLDYDKNIHQRALLLTKLFLKKVDVVVGISPGVCAYFEKELNVPLKKLRLILNAVAIDRFNVAGFNRDHYRAELGFERNQFLLGMFANFRLQKNHANLIRAVAILRKKGLEDIRVLLCGTGPTEAETRKLTEEMGLKNFVKFLGPRSDIPELMNILDVYCLSSYFEGMPLSLLEAMAGRCPIVATDVEGIRDVVANQRNGILVRPDSPKDLAEGIERVMVDPGLREQIVSEGFSFVEKHTFQNMIKSYEDLFFGLRTTSSKGKLVPSHG